MTNRLAQASSPYLRQHADNPVHWQEWGDFAFSEARRRDVPILLSVGYAACHWCHVMAHESFESEAIAAILNQGFVSIKVDREERPDVDAIYMAATQAMTGQGGWPMTVFLDHELKPFYAGTYFPPESRGGLPGFGELLEAVTEAWRDRRTELAEVAESLRHDLELQNRALPSEAISGRLIEAALGGLSESFDRVHGGFGGAPKFPPSTVLGFLASHAAVTGSESSREMLGKTMRAMALGGLYDQLGGGFARYCVDADWTVPHFEKMLYDNAQLLSCYARWARLPGLADADRELALRITRELVNFLLTELATSEGLLASALDADSETDQGASTTSNPEVAEGAFYCWTLAEFLEALGAEHGAGAANFFGVTERGNFEPGLNVLTRRESHRDGASLAGGTESHTPSAAEINAWRETLLAKRAKRARPSRDDKAVTAWNALAVCAIIEAGVSLHDSSLISRAEALLERLWQLNVVETNHSLTVLRSSIGGAAGQARGTLEDYAALVLALQRCYAATGGLRQLQRSEALLETTIALFHDGATFSDVELGREDLIYRPRSVTEQATPTGVSLAAAALLVSSELGYRDEHRAMAERELATLALLVGQAPRFAGHALEVALGLLDGPVAIAVTADPGSPLHHAALASLRPLTVVAVGVGAPPALLAGRSDAEPLAYLCRARSCRLPSKLPSELEIALLS